MTKTSVSRAGHERDKLRRLSGPLKALKFVIKLDEETWQKIKPVEVVYGDRTYQKLNSPWTDVITVKIWEKYQLPCPWSFKKSQGFKGDEFPYFKFFGSCKKCNARIEGKCSKKPISNTGVKICIETSDTTQIPHFKKRRLAKGSRKEAKQTLKGIKATHYKHFNADEILNDSGTVPPYMHNTAVYRTARQEAKDEDIGLAEFPGCPITSLLSMMDRVPSIREISTVPFVVWYWTENQLNLWREAAELNTFVSLDASGRFVKAVNVFAGQSSGQIFLYHIVIRLKKKIYSVCQMLSESHDTHCIFTWLFAWTESGAPIPKEVVVDCSMALLNAVSLAFNGCYYKDYLLKCYRFLMKQNAVLPHCLIKRDRAHLIKAVLRWKCFSGNSWVQSDFYVRCIGYSLEVEDFKLLQKVMAAMFIVCESQNADRSTECFKRKSWLENKIATFDYSKYYETEDNNDESNDEQNINYDHVNEGVDADEISTFVHEIHSSSLLLCSSDDASLSKPNNYYLPKIVGNLIILFTQFPAWSNVMRSHYASPNIVSTSTGSECYYRIMRRDYSMNPPVSLNRFLLLHLRIINGGTKLGHGVVREIKSTLQEDIIRKSSQKITSFISSRNNLNIPDSTEIQASSLTEEEAQWSVDALESKKCNSTDAANICSTEHVPDHNKKGKASFSDAVTQLIRHYMRANKPYITVAQYITKGIEFCIIQHHVLWSTEFVTLKPKRWIDGSIIDSFMIINSKDWKNVSFFPTSQTIFMIGDYCMQNKPRSWPLYDIDYDFHGLVFLPYCFKFHWCLLILNTKRKTITHIDPLIETHSGDRAIKAFLRYLTECSPGERNSLCSTDWEVVSATNDRRIQTDGYNCGAFIMYYIDCLGRRESCDDANFDPNVYRNDIAYQLISSSETMNNMCLYCLNDKKGVCSTCKVCHRWVYNECVSRKDNKVNQDTIVVNGTCLLCAK